MRVILSKDEIKAAITEYVERKTGKKTSGAPTLEDPNGVVSVWVEAEVYIVCPNTKVS